MIADPKTNGQLDLSALCEIDAACDSFEQDIRAGKHSSPNDYLHMVRPRLARDLLRELVLLEVEMRQPGPSLAPDVSDQENTHSVSSEQTQSNLVDETHSTSSNLRTKTLPRGVGKFILLEEIGSGSFGVVYRAEDCVLGKIVAVKIAHARLLTDHNEKRSFVREARNASKLSHPGIVPVYDVDQIDSIPLLVSEFVDGPNLKTHRSRNGRLSYRESARLVAEVAEALAHSHSRGVYHRDVKPTNIVLESIVVNDESSGLEMQQPRARILDFGIARVADSSTIITEHGDFLGSPAYMSPEQARGQSHDVDGRADIYSLGAVFYELICDSTPFIGEAHQLVHQIASHEVPMMSFRSNDLPFELATICHKCLRLNPDKRYQSADALAMDLRKWLAGQPIQARPIGYVDLAVQYMASHKWFAVCVLLLIVLLVSVGYQGLTRFSNLSDESTHRLTNSLDDHTFPISWRSGSTQSPLNDSRVLAWITHNLPSQLLRDISNQPNLDAKNAAQSIKHVLKENDLDDLQALKLSFLLTKFDPQERNRTIFSSRQVKSLISAGLAGDVVGWGDLGKDSSPALGDSLLREYELESDEIRRMVVCKLLARILSSEPDLMVQALRYARPKEIKILTDALSYDLRIAKDALDRAETSIHDENISEASESNLAQRANFVLANYAMDDLQPVWNSLKFLPDPRLRTNVMHWLAESECSPTHLVERLKIETDPSILYSILIALGRYDASLWDQNQFKCAHQWMLDAYQSHPDAGVHSACRWSLSKWKLDDQLKDIDIRLSNEGIVPGRRWFVNSLGMTFSIVSIPDAIWTGHSNKLSSSASDEKLPEGNRYFAIGMTEVTVEQYQQYLRAIGREAATKPDEASQYLPATNLDWYECNRFCQWLNEQEGQTLEDNRNITFLTDDTVRIDYAYPGYRLPTNFEWEFASRAGTTTDYFFGRSESRFTTDYVVQAPSIVSQVAQKIPNQLGLFETIGNVYELTSTLHSKRSLSDDFRFELSNQKVSIIVRGVSIVVRGGGADNVAFYRSNREIYHQLPNSEGNISGFRVAKPLKDSLLFSQVQPNVP